MSRQRREQASPRTVRESEAQLVLRLLKFAMVLLIFGERLGIPFGGSYVSPILPAAIIISFALYRMGAFVEDRTRTLAYVVGIAACLASGLTTLAMGLPQSSLTSMLLLVVMYSPFCLVLRSDLHHLYRPLLQFFSKCLLVIAVIAVLQFGAQLAGIWTFTDYWTSWVPHAITVQNYQEPYPIHYGSPLIKSDGFFCLEASFCSQFLGLGIIVQLLLGEKQWRILLFGLGLLATVSGTGVILLGAGLVALMVQRGFKWSARVLATLAVTVGLASLTAPGQAEFARATEFKYTTTSGNQRFVSPYQRMWKQLGTSDEDLFLGTGPGSGDRQDQDILAASGLPAVDPALPKLAIEYGLPAAVLFTGAILIFICARPRSPTIAASMVVFDLILAANLLEAQAVFVVWLFVSIFSTSIGGVRHQPMTRANA